MAAAGGLMRAPAPPAIVFRGPKVADETQRCLLGDEACDEGRRCEPRYTRSCLDTPILPWRHTFARIRCCFACCTRYWMAVNRLSGNEEHWSQLRGRVSWTEETDDWSRNNLLPHAGGESMLGHMSFALLAEGNVFDFRRVNRLKFVLHAQSRRLFVMHSNSVNGTMAMLEWLNSSAGQARLAAATAASIISRDDADMPSGAMLSQWEGLRRRWEGTRGMRMRWFVQNVAGATGAADGISPLPIGVREPLSLAAFLAQANGIEARVEQRDRLLMCCCMQNATATRQTALRALLRNGFACDESDLPRGRERQVLNQSGAPSSWRYYAGLGHAQFVASPEGYGRDCYRTWEALVLGAVPVLLSRNASPLDRLKFEGLPVVWVDSWEQVTRPFLESRWAALQRCDSGARTLPAGSALDMRRAYFPHWLGEIRHHASHHHSSR